MLRSKKLTSLVLAIIMIMSLALPTYAIDGSASMSYEEQETRLNEIVSQIVFKRIELWKLEDEAATANNQATTYALSRANAIENELDSLYTELDALGAEILNYEEFQALNLNPPEGNNAIPYADDWGFTDTSTIQYVVSGVYSVNKNGKPYWVRTVQCIPKNRNSLLTIHSGIDMYKSSQIGNFATKMAGIYIQKAIGTVKWVQWLPYELLFDGQLDDAIRTLKGDYSIDTILATTVKYAYVADGTKDKNDQRYYYLCLQSYSVSVSETHVVSWVKNGVADQESETVQRTIWGDYYNSMTTRAVTNYVDGGTQYGYYEIIQVEPIVYVKSSSLTDITDNNKQVVKTITPRAGAYNPENVT